MTDGVEVEERGGGEMAAEFCQKCKQAHPGRVCDYDEKGECAETTGVNDVAETNEPAKDEEDEGRSSGASKRL